MVASLPMSAQELVAAVQQRDELAATRAIESGADVNSRSPDGTSALHWAVYNDAVQLVQRLVDAHADVNAANSFGSTPLSEAALIGNPEVMKVLLDAGAEVDAPGKDGQTALMIVARTDKVAAARLLIEHGADVNAKEVWRDQTALIWAAAEQQPDMIRLLIEHGADPNARSKPTDWQRQISAERRRQYRPFGGMTALLYASREGCLECARALVDGGADPDLSDPRNVTPLIEALDNLHFDLARYLVGAGATLDMWDWWGRTPLYMAVDMSTLTPGGRPDRRPTDATTGIEVVAQILDAGANPNIQLKQSPPYRDSSDRGCDSMLNTGATPLLRAAKTFDAPAMRLLVAHGARVDLPNASGITPLMAAAGYGSVECDIRGYGPGIPHYLTKDVQEKSIAALQVLLEGGANIDARTTGGARGRGPGQTALFGAAFWGWNDVVKFLVESGAKINVADAEGRTPVDAALGKAGGHERGSSVQVFDDTAELLRTLCGAQADCDLAVLERPAS
jgi:ankyrin repeat protein